MLSCGAILTRSGPFNKCTTLGLASKGCNMQRNISVVSKNKFFKTQLLGSPLQCLADIQNCGNPRRVLASHISFKCNNSSYSRSLCLRKINTHLLSQSSSCTTDVKHHTENRHISKDGGGSENFIETDIGAESKLSKYQKFFKDDDEEPEHRVHVRKEEIKIGEIEKLYPNPKANLNEIFTSVSSQLQKSHQVKYEIAQSRMHKNSWVCNLKITWPDSITITATAKNKPGVGKVAAWKCLQLLHNEGKLKNGIPIVYEKTEMLEMLNNPTTITIEPETLESVKNLLNTYNTEIREVIKASKPIERIHEPGISEENTSNLIGRTSLENSTPQGIERRNAAMKSRLDYRSLSESANLPITEYRDQILKGIENNRALLIKGDTGCGKTTQVPQFIMDSFIAKGKATDCNMIVSQPRKISAVSLAERIAEERKEQIGEVVGYQVRLQQRLPMTPGSMLFCTTGILLRKMQSNPGLVGCSHVILDEAHERSINTDMLLVLLKRALDLNPDLKIIIMSATINADLFQQYFNCGVVEVPGRTFPVKMNFLGDIEDLGINSTKEYLGNADVPETPYVDCDQISDLITWISKNKPPGAILCFLPGWADIVRVKTRLEQNYVHGRDMIVPVHSRMPPQDQRKIFTRPPQGVRKIVLATDIAETGITVADVVYVVDSAVRKAMRWHEKKGFATMDNQYASQANINQRKGRAGRVQPGESYHFVTLAQFEKLDVYPLPEVLCSSLEKTVLDCKTYSDEKVETFLGSMPQPPTLSAVRKAIYDLAELGALDANENLTPLGRRISLFSTHPKLSKAMVYASIFQCVSPIITIASAMSAENEIFTGTLFDKEAIRGIKQKYHPSSDHISIAWMVKQWEEYNQRGKESAAKFCYQHKLHAQRVFTLSKIRDMNAEHLAFVRMLTNPEEYDDLSSPYNEYASLDELVRGVLLSGLDQLLHRRDFDIKKGKVKRGTTVFAMEDGTRATITPESVNFKRAGWPSPFLTYVRRQHSEERRTTLIRETSMVSPITALLFSQARIHGFKKTEGPSNDILLTIKGRKNFKLSCGPQTATTLLEFRDSIWSVVRYLVEKHGYVDETIAEEYNKVNEFKQTMLQVLGDVLSETAKAIDEPEAKVKKERKRRWLDDDDD